MSDSKPNWSRLLLLGGLTAALGGVAFWVAKNKPKEDAKKEDAKKIFLLSGGESKDGEVQIKSVSLFGTKNVRLECLDLAEKKCKPGDSTKWAIKLPSDLKADNTNANSLVSSLNNLMPAETIELKDETPEKRNALLKEYGLDPAARASAKRVEVETSQGTTVMVLGGIHPIGENLFAAVEKTGPGTKPSGKIDETKIYLIANFFKSNFDKDLTHWRDKKILALNAHEIVEFSLKSAKEDLKGFRKDGNWELKSPKGDSYSGDGENIDNLITGTTYLMAKDFAAENLATDAAKALTKNAKPIMTLGLKTEKETYQIQFLQVGSVPPPTKGGKKSGQKNDKSGKEGAAGAVKMYLTVSGQPTLYEVEPGSKDRFDKTLKELRLTKLITNMERFGAKRLEFSGPSIGSPSLIIAQKDGKWVVESAQAPAKDDKSPGSVKEVSSDKIITLLERLSGNRVKDFLSGSTYPSGEGDALVLTLGDEKTTTKRKYAIWKKGESYYAKDLLSSRKEALLLDSVLKDSLPLAPGSRDFFKKEDPKPAPTSGHPVHK